jgi:hypothetical protein
MRENNMNSEQSNGQKLNKQQTKKLIPAIKAFNKMAEIFISLLNKKIKEKETKINRIRVMVKDVPLPQRTHNISIQTVDLNTTMVKTKGGSSFNQRMDWEKDLRKKNRGILL